MRGVSLLIVVLAVLLMLVITLGATGFSDRVLNALVSEEIRGLRQSLAQTIRDPDALERVIAERREELIRSYGLDKPWYLRVPDMVMRVLRLDLGEARTLRSFSGSNRVADIVLERIPYTIILVTTAAGITAVIGLLAGVKLAIRAGSRLDRAASYMSAVSNALPSWWLGILMLILFVFYARLFPPGGLLSTPPPTGPLERGLDILWHAALPIITLVLVTVGPWTYVARTMVLNTAQEDFVSAARAKGLPERIMMRRYVIRVAAPPILTNITLGIAASLGGAILTETVFNWPGMGRLYYEAILQADEAVIVALTFIYTLIYVAARFFLEVLYIVLDPRVRYLVRLALREQASGFLSTGSARAGTLMLIILTAVSLYVVATYPLDYGVRFWNNPSFWVDNPKAVPPSWVSLLTGSREFEHTVLEATSPAQRLEGEDLYTFSFRLEADKAPTLLSISLREITYYGPPPFIVATMTRPDGSVITLLRRVVTGPREGEEPPIRRYYDTPLRVYLGGDESAMNSLAGFLSSRYGLRLSTRELRGMYEEAVFGVPSGGEPASFTPLKGDYEVRVRFVKGSPGDSLGSLRVVLGGTVFGAMGTDSVGRDIALGLLFCFPVALFIGLLASTLATAIGAALGMLSGYIGGKVDVLIQRASDIVANVPLLPILIFLSFLFRPNLLLIILILVAFGWPGLTIVVRSMVLQAKSSGFVEAAVAIGASRVRIIARHIFPQVAPFVISQMIFFVPSAILAEAALSFLGLGDPTIPTWGQILELGFRTGGVFTGYWWWVLPPGILIVITAMTFVLLALGMEPIINPRIRQMR